MDDVLKFAIALVEKGGPAAVAGILALMWWLERADRKDAQKEVKATQEKLEKVLERVVIAMEGTAASIREFRLMSKDQHK